MSNNIDGGKLSIIGAYENGPRSAVDGRKIIARKPPTRKAICISDDLIERAIFFFFSYIRTTRRNFVRIWSERGRRIAFGSKREGEKNRGRCSGSCRATIYRLACVVTLFHIIRLGRKLGPLLLVHLITFREIPTLPSSFRYVCIYA